MKKHYAVVWLVFRDTGCNASSKSALTKRYFCPSSVRGYRSFRKILQNLCQGWVCALSPESLKRLRTATGQPQCHCTKQDQIRSKTLSKQLHSIRARTTRAAIAPGRRQEHVRKSALKARLERKSNHKANTHGERQRTMAGPDKTFGLSIRGIGWTKSRPVEGGRRS